MALTLDDGSCCVGQNSIKKEAVNYFQALLGGRSSSYPGKACLAQYVSKRVQYSPAMVCEVSCEEVKNVLFSIDPSKAPSPDGFNGFFFKRVWHIIGEEIVTTVQRFFTSGHMIKEINTTTISLIPKVQNPSSLTDFRPISCCNTIYKCISKIIANRIKEALPSLVDPAQSAFIPGRQIRDNILLLRKFSTITIERMLHPDVP